MCSSDLGDVKEGEALYRQVIDETAHPPSEIWKPLHQQAERALAHAQDISSLSKKLFECLGKVGFQACG